MDAHGQPQTNKSTWVAQFPIVAALTCSFWIVYRFYSDIGPHAGIAAFVGLAMSYAFGSAPMFGVAASILALQFNIWFPLVAYGFLKLLPLIDLQWETLQQKNLLQHLLGSAEEV